MLDGFLFVGLAYASLLMCVVGLVYRIWINPFSQTARTSQFLESRTLIWGIVPFHIGVIVVLLGHLIAILMPGLWQAAMSHRAILLGVEAVGLGSSALCVLGICILIWRRLVTSRLQPVTTTMDLVVLGLLLVQVIGGISIAMGHRWGAAWAPQTVVPYLWSLVYLQPDVGFIAEMAPMIKAHIVLAWVLILLIPFSRLSHFFALPLSYIVRPPQRVVWNNARHEPAPASERAIDANRRRLFIRGASGTGVALGLLSVGTADSLFQFFRGSDSTKEEEEELLSKKVTRIELTLNQRKLELERMNATHVHVADYKDLNDEEGKYFIDFEMNPAMAFIDRGGLPIVLSAKCTHLGCTVGNTLDDKGRVLCPCHVSYFDIKTGEPNKGAPAKTALPRLGWVLKDPDDKIVASGNPAGGTMGTTDLQILSTCVLYIVRPGGENS